MKDLPARVTDRIDLCLIESGFDKHSEESYTVHDFYSINLMLAESDKSLCANISGHSISFWSAESRGHLVASDNH